MTADGLYKFLYRWAIDVVDIPAQRAYIDVTPDGGGYLVIDADSSWSRIGTHSVGDTDGTARSIGTDYEVRINIWECRGRGDNLRTLAENLDLLFTRQLFAAAGLSIMRSETILQVPELLDKTRWHVQHKFTFVLGVYRAIIEPVGSIQAVEVIGDVEDNHSEQTIQV